MAQAAQPIDEHNYTSTGLNNRKLLMWAFLGSDVMFFGTLISTHLIYRGQSLPGTPTEGVFNIPLTSISTFVLLMSSLSMVLALAAIQRGSLGGFRLWLSATALLGAIFIGFQMVEFTEFAREFGLTPRTNLFGSTFLIMTGFHGAHVTIGVIWLASLVVSSYFGKIKQETSLDVEIAGLYWHFVDIVWIVIFGVVYLIGALGAEKVEPIHSAIRQMI
jgi:heme/copper-type cytochrome/quinol oxidase subunit 3